MGYAKDAGIQIVSGGSAGLVEVCIMHPLDTVKTRLQMSGGYYNGLKDCFKKTIKNEGFKGFYKGILPPILVETPKRATKFFTFEQYKQLFVTPSTPQWFSLSLAGLCSGLTEAVLVCPFEVIKVRQQANREKMKLTTGRMAREIIKEHGFGTKGIFLGLDATLARNGTWNMVYFGLYHNLKIFIPSEKESKTKNVTFRLFTGFIAGSLASIVNIPFDVAKSRIQAPQPNGVRIYFNVFQSVKLVAKTEGYKALYRGLLPKLMRLGPGGSIMLFVYETVFEFMNDYFK